MPLTLSGTTGIAGVDGSAGTPATKGSDTDTGVFFPSAGIAAVATNGVEAFRADTSQNLLVGVTSANANGGVLQLKSGITFPATQVTSTDVNTLDDYEEGTWTPVANSLTVTSGSVTWTGYYTKIGNIVTVSFRASGTYNITITAGTTYLTGLPFGRTSGTIFEWGIFGNASTSTSSGALQMASASIYFTATLSGVTGGISGTITYQST